MRWSHWRQFFTRRTSSGTRPGRQTLNVGWSQSALETGDDGVTLRTRKVPTTPRPAQQDDYQAWFDAAANREMPRKTDIEHLRAYMEHLNPHRWRRLQKDVRWIEAEMAKLGLTAEDARWML